MAAIPTWSNVPLKNIEAEIFRLYDHRDDTGDIRIHCIGHGEFIPAHKLVLGVNSKYFFNILSSAESEDDGFVDVFLEEEPDVLKKVIEIVYKSQTVCQSKTQKEKVKKLAKQFKVKINRV